MADDSLTVRITDNRDRQRYEAHVGHSVAGFATYELTPGRITFAHTKTEPGFEGRGVASQLAAFALEDARARGLRVTVRCPFFASYLESNPGYADLVDAQ